MTSPDPSAATVRQAVAADVTALAAFINPFVEVGKLLPRTRKELKDLVKYGYVAVLDNQIVGFAALEVYSSKLGEIRSLAVAENCQGHGVGTRLVKACVERAHQENILEVMVITSSEVFFRSCGFDFTLPGEKKALFIQTRDANPPT